MNCGEVREIAAHGLCFACYRREQREGSRSVDLHSPGIQGEHCRLFAGYCQILKALSVIGVSEPDVTRIKQILAPYLQLVEPLLNIAGDRMGDSPRGMHPLEEEERDNVLVNK